ncbi:threonylcarbamoyl-AMP synthase [Proteobacteria bacterium 005FR1]|nr:threonylcarbamoyl-AMP synthase [Proteobacteria bacterium 005FR1]
MHASDQLLEDSLLLTSASAKVLSPTDSAIQHAAAILKAGGLVALPTETVYGLGADAESETAVAAIFAAKGRPADHPLIIHLASAQLMTDYARDIPAQAWRLAGRFWPGPLTLILKRKPGVSHLVTGGQDTVGLRIPAHPVAQKLLKSFGRGIAAPSANRFGRISPTRAGHVVSELGGQVDCILDGGPCTVGLESTILDLSGSEPRVLRPGAIGALALARELGVEPGRGSSGAPRVSGSLPSHYAPSTPLRLVDSRDLIELAMPGKESLAVMALQPALTTREQVHWLSMPAEAQEYARQLFARLRELDEQGHACIYVERPPAGAEWDAVHDRLIRAATRAGSEKTGERG